MKKLLPILFASTLFSAAALAQDQQTEGDVMAGGKALYDANCSACHQANGAGMPPTFPAFAGNDNLADLEHVLTTIQEGRGAMPAFPQLSHDDKSALVTYLRSSWGNDFGAVSPAEVEAVLGADTADSSHQADIVSAWSGVYTEAQATRIKGIYESACAMCHGARMDGAALDPDRASAPPLARYTFLRNWDGRSLGALYEYSRSRMPEQSPGSLSDQEYVDIIAYMLSVSGMPAGDTELAPDVTTLSSILISQEP